MLRIKCNYTDWNNSPQSQCHKDAEAVILWTAELPGTSSGDYTGMCADHATEMCHEARSSASDDDFRVVVLSNTKKEA